jgi:TetR/AcrR family transcriptional repressor of nem operon
MGDLNERFREKLDGVLERMKVKVIRCLEEAREKGQLSGNRDVAEMAEFTMNSWQGTLLRMKVTRDRSPWKIFESLIFEDILSGDG